jgi:Tol biopolymer transport system component
MTRRRERSRAWVRLAVLGMLASTTAVLGLPSSALADVVGAVALASHTAAGTGVAAGGSSQSVVSADGRFVAFISAAADIVPGQTDTNAATDVFLYERSTGAVTLVSHIPGSPTTASDHDSAAPVISADGDYVAFESRGQNLVVGQTEFNNNVDIFLYRRTTGAVTLVSHVAGSPVTTASNYSIRPAMSGDGGIVAFESGAPEFVGPGDFTSQVFVYERSTGMVRMASHAATGPTSRPSYYSYFPQVSRDGAFVGFNSQGNNLVAGQVDTGQAESIYLFEVATGTVTLASHVFGEPLRAANASAGMSMNADASYVSFHSNAPNLVANQVSAKSAPGDQDVYVYERATGLVTLVSHAPGAPSTTANGGSFLGSISADGSYIAFESYSTNLVTGGTDLNGQTDVFLFRRSTGDVTLVSHVPSSRTATGNATNSFGGTSISADGSHVAFGSSAANLVPRQTDSNGAEDVFIADTATKVVTLASHLPGNLAAAGNGRSRGDSNGNQSSHGNPQSPSLSADGAYVAFTSAATNLIAGQTGGTGTNAFVAQRSVVVPKAPADFDGDGDTDIAVYRRASGQWFISGGATVFFGTADDVPVPADYDGNGTTDVAVFRPSVGGWYRVGAPTTFFGLNDDIPVPCDYDGDGDVDIAVFRPSVGGWYRVGAEPTFLGLSGDIPVPADYDGDGACDISVFRPSVGGWYRAGGATFFGLAGDIPVPADYDAEPGAEIAVFRPSVGGWYRSGATTSFLGFSGDVPVPGAYAGGVTQLAVFRPSTGAWYVAGQAAVSFGLANDVALPLPAAVRQAFFP